MIKKLAGEGVFNRFYKISPQIGMMIETGLFNTADQSPDYNGGCWEQSVIGVTNNTSFYFPDGEYKIGNSLNYTNEKIIKGKAFGLYCTMVVYNTMAWRMQEHEKLCAFFSDQYYMLREYLLDTKDITDEDREHILKLLD